MGLSKEELNNRKRTSKIITHKEFVREWVRAYKNDESLVEVAERLGTSRRHVYSRAQWLRNIGVKLPAFKERHYIGADDIENLNDLIDEADL